MRIAIDARGVQPKLQGVGRHVLNLLLGLSARESDLEFMVLYSNPLARKLVDRSGGAFRGRFQWIKTRSAPGSFLERAEIPWLLKINKAALFHDVGSTGAWTGDIPSIVTVHELAGLRFPPKLDATRFKRALRHARLIVTVSNSLAEEVESAFNISRPKIRVISNAIDPWYTERVTESEIRAMRERFRLQGSYFLSVTADRPNKNMRLVRDLAAEWNGNEQWVFTAAGSENESVRFLDVVEDVWLRPLYAAAKALVVPSLYEGFSLPPVEALAAGALPVVSDIPAHREILGAILPERLFFNPGSSASLLEALRAVQEGGEPMLASVLEKFRAVRDRHSFIETANQVQSVYREALG